MMMMNDALEEQDDDEEDEENEELDEHELTEFDEDIYHDDFDEYMDMIIYKNLINQMKKYI